jgi:hypothetical protein
MLNTPWIDPRKIDWTDSLNPLTGRGWGKDPSRNPYMFDTLSDPIFLAIRKAQNLEPRIWVVPDPIDQIIAAGSTYDMSVAIEPNTWLYGINTWLAPVDGGGNDFYVQITDAVTGATLFSQQVHASDLQPTIGNTTSTKGVIGYLSTPKLFVPPSYPMVRIVNLGNSAYKCNVNLFCAVEIPF